MFFPKELRECSVHGGRIVRPGCEVHLLPINLREEDIFYGKLFAEKRLAFLEKALGKGPFIVSRIIQFPWASPMLCLLKARAHEQWVVAHEFM